MTELDQKVTLDHQSKRCEERTVLWGVDVSRFQFLLCNTFTSSVVIFHFEVDCEYSFLGLYPGNHREELHVVRNEIRVRESKDQRLYGGSK